MIPNIMYIFYKTLDTFYRKIATAPPIPYGAAALNMVLHTLYLICYRRNCSWDKDISSALDLSP